MSITEIPSCASQLKGDPLPWLLQESNPCVRYRTLTELLDRPAEDPEVRGTVEAVPDYPPAAAMLSALGEMEPFPEGTAWSMSLFKKNLGDLDTLHRFGIPGGHPAITRACGHWLAVELFPHPECYPMQLIGGLIRYADRDDARLQERIRYVVANEPFTDGNRPGILRYGYGRGGCTGSHSCHLAAVKALWAIVGLPVEKRTPEVDEIIRRGARYLAAHRLYQSSHRSGKVIAKQFLNLQLPLAMTCDTDILDLLDIATQVGLESDACIADALNMLLSKQNNRGRWRVEAPSRWTPDTRRLAGHAATIEAVGDESKWTTLSALIVTERCEHFLAGDERTDVRSEADLDAEPAFSHYPFEYSPADERRVRNEYAALGLEQVMEQLVDMGRKLALEPGWHWGYVMGPPLCREWFAARARWIPRRGMATSWPVCRVHFLTRAGQFSEGGLAKSLRIPVVDEAGKRQLKKHFWRHLWRIRIATWRDNYDEVAITIRDAREVPRLRPLLEVALRELPLDQVHVDGQQTRAIDADKPRG